jgi:hypothetical protein
LPELPTISGIESDLDVRFHQKKEASPNKPNALEGANVNEFNIESTFAKVTWATITHWRKIDMSSSISQSIKKPQRLCETQRG